MKTAKTKVIQLAAAGLTLTALAAVAVAARPAPAQLAGATGPAERVASRERPRILVKDPDDAAGKLDLVRLSARQVHHRIELEIATRNRWPVRALRGHPSVDDERAHQYLCLAIRPGGGSAQRACFGPASSDGRPRLYAGAAGPGGQVGKWSPVAKTSIARPDRRSIAVSVPYAALGLGSGRVRIQALSAWSSGICAAPEPATGNDGAKAKAHASERPRDPCVDTIPGDGFSQIRLLKPVAVGCRARRLDVVRSGPSARRRVALTFDDGPSAYTSSVLEILADHGAHATFFMVGSQVSADPQMTRRVLREGHELANHSTNHSSRPSGSDLAETQRRIRSASGFTPCLFRPPYGDVGGNTVPSARLNRLETVVWSIDTRDWTLPGSTAIRSSALGARPGSIVLMHDGGGPRSQTVAALPAIIRGLQDRGYKLVTVSKLLGNKRLIWP